MTQAPALQPGLILSLLISIAAQRRLRTSTADEARTRLPRLRPLAEKKTMPSPTIGGIVPVQRVLSGGFGWCGDAAVLRCFFMSCKLISVNTQTASR